MGRRKKSNEELEELTRTQVLNLQELEHAAKYEKKTSKKPAAVLAILGVFLFLSDYVILALIIC